MVAGRPRRGGRPRRPRRHGHGRAAGRPGRPTPTRPGWPASSFTRGRGVGDGRRGGVWQPAGRRRPGGSRGFDPAPAQRRGDLRASAASATASPMAGIGGAPGPTPLWMSGPLGSAGPRARWCWCRRRQADPGPTSRKPAGRPRGRCPPALPRPAAPARRRGARDRGAPGRRAGGRPRGSTPPSPRSPRPPTPPARGPRPRTCWSTRDGLRPARADAGRSRGADPRGHPRRARRRHQHDARCGCVEGFADHVALRDLPAARRRGPAPPEQPGYGAPARRPSCPGAAEFATSGDRLERDLRDRLARLRRARRPGGGEHEAAGFYRAVAAGRRPEPGAPRHGSG